VLNRSVLILPHGFDPNKEHEAPTYWAARIKDIRANEVADESNSVSFYFADLRRTPLLKTYSNLSKVWVRVQWFYSGKDVSDVIKSL